MRYWQHDHSGRVTAAEQCPGPGWYEIGAEEYASYDYLDDIMRKDYDMLTKLQVSWKNEANARAWCKAKGYRFLSAGPFDVFYVTPEQEGKKMDVLGGGTMDAYSRKNWLDVFADMDAANIEKVSRK